MRLELLSTECNLGVKGLDAPKQEWCRLSAKAKRAIQQWVAGRRRVTSVMINICLVHLFFFWAL